MNCNPRLSRLLITAVSPLLIGLAWTAPLAAAGSLDGAALYKSKCAMCHGPDGAGNTPIGKKLKVLDLQSAEVQKQSDAELSARITQGKGKMPAFKTLSADQNKQLVVYIRQLGKK